MATDTCELLEPPTDRNPPRRRIRWLIAAHAAAMCSALAIKWVWPSSGVDLLGGLKFAQITLLAIWFALGRGRWPARMLKSLACVAAVVVVSDGLSGGISLLQSGWNFLVEILILQAMMAAWAWVTAAGGVTLAKRWGPRFDIVEVERLVIDRSAPQFSIRSLFVATLVSACVLAIVRLIRANFDPQHVESFILMFCFFAPMIAVYSGMAAVAYVWAGLGVSHLLLRIVAAMLLQIALLLLLSFTFSREWYAQAFSLQLCYQFMEAAVIIGSLLLVRSCGYRVVSRSAKPAEQMPLAAAADVRHPLD